MATITITRDLTARGGSSISPLIPVFVRNSIEFSVVGTEEEMLGSYATVKAGEYEFRTVKTIINGSTHNHIIDLSGVLPFLMDRTAYTEVGQALTASPEITIQLYSASGILITSVTHPPVYLCFAYTDITYITEYYIYTNGSSRPIYHNGINICFFWGGETGDVTLKVGSSEDVIYMEGGKYNMMYLDNTPLLKTGTLTSPDLLGFSIPIYYKPPFGDNVIMWLNRDGGWSFWNFRQISSETKVKKSNEVATYYPTNFRTIAMSQTLSAEKTVEYTFDTLAYDDVHFAQLCEIQESLSVIWNNKLMRVSGCNSLTSVCKQNLRFTLKLEVDENIAGY